MRHRSSGVEHSIRNRAVVGSNPTGGSRYTAVLAGVAQLVEHQLPKLRVAGSSPVSRFAHGADIDGREGGRAALGSFGGVPKRLNGTDCKSVGHRPTKVRILPPP